MCIPLSVCALSKLAKIILAEIVVTVQTAAGRMFHCATADSTAPDLPTLQPCLEGSISQSM
jgi:hypothetical protein